MDSRTLITWVVIGLIAGFLAHLVLGGGGILRWLVSGMLGSLVGGVVFQKMGWRLGLPNPILEQIAISTVGALIVIVVLRIVY